MGVPVAVSSHERLYQSLMERSHQQTSVSVLSCYTYEAVPSEVCIEQYRVAFDSDQML